jgi:hypothetical protein
MPARGLPLLGLPMKVFPSPFSKLLMHPRKPRYVGKSVLLLASPINFAQQSNNINIAITVGTANDSARDEQLDYGGDDVKNSELESLSAEGLLMHLFMESHWS